MNELIRELLPLKDEKFKNFTAKLIPDTSYKIIGVKVPTVRKIAAKYYGKISITDFTYYEECLCYGFIIAGEKTDIDTKINKLKEYLRVVDSWGLTDSVAAAFKDAKKEKQKTLRFIYDLLDSDKVYEKRFGIVLLLQFTGSDFDMEQLSRVLKVKTGEYYVDMAIAWYISVLLVKNYSLAVTVIENRLLPPFIHNKAITKATESYRITGDVKEYLKTLKIKNNKNS